VLPWWGWLLFWLVLLAASAAFLARRGWKVWGSTRALGTEVSRAGALVAALEARADELREAERAGTAVSQPVHRVRAEYREQRATSKAARQARRADRLPPWARVD
jgi:hypothetical protein